MRNVSCENSRCPVCGTRPDPCVCAGLPRLCTRTRLLFVQHPAEAHKPTNSTRLVCHIVATAEIAPWNRLSPPIPPGEALLLYPFADAPTLSPADFERAGTTLVIPDGTWSQAARIAGILRRAGLTPRRLPDVSIPTWRVRTSTEADRVSSGQAAAAALALSGEHDAAALVADALAEAARRILAMRGLHEPSMLSPSQQAGQGLRWRNPTA